MYRVILAAARVIRVWVDQFDIRRCLSIAVCFLALIATNAVAVELFGSDILVLNAGGQIIRVDPITGDQTIVATIPATFTFGIALDTDGDIFVTDAFGNRIIRVDPATGNQAFVPTDGGLSGSLGIAIDANGDLLVVSGAGIVRVDPLTGAQTTVSSEVGGFGIAIDANGDLLVVSGGIIRVDPLTGAQTTVSSGGMFTTLLGIAPDTVGNLFVTNSGEEQRSIIRVDPLTGAQTLVSSGGSLTAPFGIVVDANGDLLVADTTNPGAIIRVDPLTGAQTTVSSGGILGPAIGITVVPGNPFPRVNIEFDGGSPQECSETNGKTVSFTANIKVAPEDSVAAVEWLLDGASVASGENVDIFIPLDAHTVEVVVTTAQGQTATDSEDIQIIDTLPPAIPFSFTDAKGNSITEVTRAGLNFVTISFSADDICDSIASASAFGGVNINDGDVVPVNASTDQIKLNATSLLMRVTATDASENVSKREETLNITD